jgi:hypothetical protein
LPSVFPQNLIETELFTGLLSRKTGKITKKSGLRRHFYLISLSTVTLLATISTGCGKIRVF